MSKHNKIDPRTAREAKRARFDGKSGGASPMVLILGLVVVLALIGGALFALTRPSPTAAEASNAAACSPVEQRAQRGPGFGGQCRDPRA